MHVPYLSMTPTLPYLTLTLLCFFYVTFFLLRVNLVIHFQTDVSYPYPYAQADLCNRYYVIGVRNAGL